MFLRLWVRFFKKTASIQIISSSLIGFDRAFHASEQEKSSKSTRIFDVFSRFRIFRNSLLQTSILDNLSLMLTNFSSYKAPGCTNLHPLKLSWVHLQVQFFLRKAIWRLLGPSFLVRGLLGYQFSMIWDLENPFGAHVSSPESRILSRVPNPKSRILRLESPNPEPPVSSHISQAPNSESQVLEPRVPSAVSRVHVSHPES